MSHYYIHDTEFLNKLKFDNHSIFLNSSSETLSKLNSSILLSFLLKNSFSEKLFKYKFINSFNQIPFLSATFLIFSSISLFNTISSIKIFLINYYSINNIDIYHKSKKKL
jgi:hypothetical protein